MSLEDLLERRLQKFLRRTNSFKLFGPEHSDGAAQSQYETDHVPCHQSVDNGNIWMLSRE